MFGRPFRRDLPQAVREGMEPQERVLAASGGIVAGSRGLWLPAGAGAGGYRRVPWHLISKVVWRPPELAVVEAERRGEVGGVVVLADLAERVFTLDKPGSLPKVVWRRVTDSVVSSHHKDLPGGGALVVQRKVTGTAAVTVQVRAEPGTDPGAVTELAEQVASGIKRAR